MNAIIDAVRSPATLAVLGLVSITAAGHGLSTQVPLHAMLCAIPSLAASFCALVHLVAPPNGERVFAFVLFVPVFFFLALKQLFFM